VRFTAPPLSREDLGHGACSAGPCKRVWRTGAHCRRHSFASGLQRRPAQQPLQQRPQAEPHEAATAVRRQRVSHAYTAVPVLQQPRHRLAATAADLLLHAYPTR
jgi:hypothetical protein